MAVDLKIELFSIDLFRHLWFKCHLLNFVPPRIKLETGKSENSEEAVHAVWCRQQLFQQTFYKKIKGDYKLFSNNGTDFYLYIHNNVIQSIPYHLNVFDKLLMTCAFVLEMCNCSSFNSDQGYLYFAPLSWAMFFDSEFKSEFYFEGGWEVLHKYASSYSTHILTPKWMKANGTVDSDDYENVKAVFESTNKFYNTQKLVKKFIKRYKKRKDKANVSCLKCLPMFLVFKSIAFPEEPKPEQIILVEGYLQIMLRMLSTEDMEVRRREFFASLQDDDSSESNESSARNSDNPQSTNPSSSDSSSTSTEDEELETDNPAEIINGAFKLLTTAELLRRLFADETTSNVEGACGFELCIFCGEAIETTVYPKTEKFSVHVERIKSTIAKVVDMEANRKSATQIKTPDAKDVLRMFPALGLEPMRTHMLSIIEADQKENILKVVDETSEILSGLNLTESPTKRAKSKLKKSEAEQKDKTKKDVENTSEIPSSLNLTESPTKRSRNKLKKREAEQKDKAKKDVEGASEILSSLNLTESPTKRAKNKLKKSEAEQRNNTKNDVEDTNEISSCLNLPESPTKGAKNMRKKKKSIKK